MNKLLSKLFKEVCKANDVKFNDRIYSERLGFNKQTNTFTYRIAADISRQTSYEVLEVISTEIAKVYPGKFNIYFTGNKIALSVTLNGLVALPRNYYDIIKSSNKYELLCNGQFKHTAIFECNTANTKEQFNFEISAYQGIYINAGYKCIENENGLSFIRKEQI